MGIKNKKVFKRTGNIKMLINIIISNIVGCSLISTSLIFRKHKARTPEGILCV